MHGTSSPATARPADRPRRLQMLDVVFLATTVAFFALSLAYVRGCDTL
jgi:hypothetical protein